MTMTVDEAVHHVAQVIHPEDYGDNGDAMEALAAEVERLQKVVADQALTIGVLKDELATERDCSDGLTEDVLKAEKKLKRFTDREPKIDAIKQAVLEELPKAVCELEVWEQENPKL